MESRAAEQNCKSPLLNWGRREKIDLVLLSVIPVETGSQCFTRRKRLRCASEPYELAGPRVLAAQALAPPTTGVTV
jgi:hypothetical protein